MAKDYYKKQNDIMNGKLQQGNYASSSRQGDNKNEHVFMVQHMTNSVTSAEESNDVWYVDSGASNHMTGHAEWMQNARKMEKPGFVETCDDISGPRVSSSSGSHSSPWTSKLKLGESPQSNVDSGMQVS